MIELLYHNKTLTIPFIWIFHFVYLIWMTHLCMICWAQRYRLKLWLSKYLQIYLSTVNRHKYTNVGCNHNFLRVNSIDSIPKDRQISEQLYFFPSSIAPRLHLKRTLPCHKRKYWYNFVKIYKFLIFVWCFSLQNREHTKALWLRNTEGVQHINLSWWIFVRDMIKNTVTMILSFLCLVSPIFIALHCVMR